MKMISFLPQIFNVILLIQFIYYKWVYFISLQIELLFLFIT